MATLAPAKDSRLVSVLAVCGDAQQEHAGAASPMLAWQEGQTSAPSPEADISSSAGELQCSQLQPSSRES